MISFTDLYGFEVKHLDNGIIEIQDMCNFPQESKICFELHKHLDLLKIEESGVEFPLHLSHWNITITPDSDEIIKKYYSLDGIKTILDENILKLKNKKTFFKVEITYPPKSKFPNLLIHFYDIVDDGGNDIFVIDELDMFETCLIDYNTKQFTKKRIKDLNKLVRVAELQQIPFLPIELIQFKEDGSIKEIEQHELAKSASQNQ